VIKRKDALSKVLGTTLQGAASLVDRVAIVRRKGYPNRVHFPAIHSWIVFLVAVEYFQEESSCKLRLRSKRSRLNQMKPGQMVKPKVENASAELRVWCESCCIRIAPNEERTIVQGKTYHSHCYSKLSTKPKN